jgi:hypothetical protein
MSDEMEDMEMTPPPNRAWVPVAIMAVLVVGLGVVPKVMGFGFFGARLALSEDVLVHVLNTSGQDLKVTLSFTEPEDVPAGTIQTLTGISGPGTLTIATMEGEVLSTHEIDLERPLFVNAQGSECLAVVDMSPYYNGGSQTGGGLQFVERIHEDQEIYQTTADYLVLPRRTFPDSVRGTIHWIDTISCSLLDPAMEEDALMYLEGRMRIRREQQEEDRQAR